MLAPTEDDEAVFGGWSVHLPRRLVGRGRDRGDSRLDEDLHDGLWEREGGRGKGG